MLRRTFLARLAAIGLPGVASGAAQPASPKPSAKAWSTVQVTIIGSAFAQVKQPLTVGDTIEWINKDVVAHTATAKTKDWRVVIAANDRASLVLKKAGAVDYYCEYHPNMTGRIVVREKKS